MKKSDVSPSIWDSFQKIIEEIPKNELNKLPSDGAKEIDHYIYGTPKNKRKIRR